MRTDGPGRPVGRPSATEKVVVTGGDRHLASRHFPRAYRVVAPLERWFLGTDQGAVLPNHLGYYLDECTFRFQPPEFRVALQAVPAPARASGRGRSRPSAATASRSPRQGFNGRAGLTA